VYDSREKAILDYESNLNDARQEGETVGIEKGESIGRIQLLQELLGDEATPRDHLIVLPLSQLTSMLEVLQARLRQRTI
jgi:hypothetical protein